MSNPRALLIVGTMGVLSGCASLPAEQYASSVPSIPVTSNDYYQLVVVPETIKPGGSNFDCRRPQNASGSGLQGVLQNFWSNTPNRDILTAITVEYSSDQRSIKDTFPVLTLRSRNQGKKCSPGTNAISYYSPLLKTASDDNLIFHITANLEDSSSLDSSLLEGAKNAVSDLVRYAGGPEPVANVLGDFSREQLKNFTSTTMTAVETVGVGLGPGQERKKRVSLVEVETRSGKLSAGALARFQYIGSALKPMTDRVPDLGSGNPYAPLQWKIGGLPLKKAVDTATDGGWNKYFGTTDLVQLNSICRDVQLKLVENGYSSADSSALVWLMVQTHPNANVVEAMQRPDCLTAPGQDVELARFGVTLPELVQPTPDEAADLLNAEGGRFRQFFASTSSIELRVLGEKLFTFDSASPITEDSEGQIFLQGTRRIPTAESWDAYFPIRPLKLQCLSIVDDPAFGGLAALAVVKTSAGSEIPVSAHFTSVLPGRGALISKLKVVDAFSQQVAIDLIRTRWESYGRCETADSKPELIFNPTTEQPA